MDENKQDNKKEKEDKVLKKGFFKKVWYSITKIEKYGEMAAEGSGKAMIYLGKLAIILAIILSIGTIYQTDKSIKDVTSLIQNQVEDFVYKEGTLDVKNNTPIIIENSPIGKILIDTKAETTEQINQYTNSIDEEMGVIILKDRLLIKGISQTGIITYNYKDVLDQIQVQEFNKQSVIDYVHGSNIWNFYLALFLMILIYSLGMYIISILWNTAIISIFGYIATWFAKIKMRYAAIFNMSIYALTLSVLLNALYIGINIFIDFDIKYFQVMYTTVASIYLIAAIFIIKSDFIKKQIEISKIIEAQAIVKKEAEKEQEEKDKNKEEKPGEKDDKKEKDGEKESGEEPEGSQA